MKNGNHNGFNAANGYENSEKVSNRVAQGHHPIKSNAKTGSNARIDASKKIVLLSSCILLVVLIATLGGNTVILQKKDMTNSEPLSMPGEGNGYSTETKRSKQSFQLFDLWNHFGQNLEPQQNCDSNPTHNCCNMESNTQTTLEHKKLQPVRLIQRAVNRAFTTVLHNSGTHHHPFRSIHRAVAHAIFNVLHHRKRHILSSRHGKDTFTPDESSTSSMASISLGASSAQPMYTAATSQQLALIQELGKRVRMAATDESKSAHKNDHEFNSRIGQIPWGGVAPYKGSWPETRFWWAAGGPDEEDGYEILFNYLDTMKWPKDLNARGISAKLCPHHSGCPAEIALLHTIEFREKYKPWLVTPSMVDFAKTGWMFQHGFSKDGSSMVWYRPGLLHKVHNPETYIRTVVSTLEFAVADSFMRSEGSIGRYNVVVDCHKFSLSSVPTFSHVRRLVGILQDHFPHRTSFVFVVNLASAAQLFLKMIRPLLSEKLNQKIRIIPTNSEERSKILREFIDNDNIPTWLGGEDSYTFDVKTYYDMDELADDDESLEYLTSMPIHA